MKKDEAESVVFSATTSGSRLSGDQISQGPARRGIYRCAIHFANDEIVVCDLDGIWKKDWRDLYRPVD